NRTQPDPAAQMVSFLRGRVTWHGDWWTIASGQISCQSDIGAAVETAGKVRWNPTANPTMIGGTWNNRRYKFLLIGIGVPLSCEITRVVHDLLAGQKGALNG